ncbi:hypothetical protein NQZ79_g6493 [Umbelopsis isabellina]|nr:hypothetical protein NQZ79_g6493 [Umbelopsis isabellina]
MNPEEIKIDLPLIIDGMDRHDIERTEFFQQIISSRMVSRKITQTITGISTNDEAHILSIITNMEQVIRGHYNGLPVWITQDIGLRDKSDTMWRRRTKYCTLIEACTNWICLYQSYLPHESSHGGLSNLEKLALNRCIESAKTLQDLFISWLSLTPNETDCMFRPYLYHYMTTIGIYKYLAVSSHVGPEIRHFSHLSLVRFLELYRRTPLYHARKVSKLEGDLLAFLHSITVHV